MEYHSQAEASVWPNTNLSSLDPFFRREIEHRNVGTSALLTLVRLDNLDSFAAFEATQCPLRVRKGHQASYGSQEGFLPGTAGAKTGELGFDEEEGLSSNTQTDTMAIVTYSFPPPSSCMVQTIDFHSGPIFEPVMDAALRLDTLLSSAILPPNGVVSGYLPDTNHAKEDKTQTLYPRSYLLSPIHGRLDEPRGEAVALLLTKVDYAAYLNDIVPQGVEGALDVVFRNSCNQTFSFQIEAGKAPVWLGNGDYHSRQYDSMEVSQSLGQVGDKDIHREPNHCQYSVVSRMCVRNLEIHVPALNISVCVRVACIPNPVFGDGLFLQAQSIRLRAGRGFRSTDSSQSCFRLADQGAHEETCHQRSQVV